jgi:hypothetical protein
MQSEPLLGMWATPSTRSLGPRLHLCRLDEVDLLRFKIGLVPEDSFGELPGSSESHGRQTEIELIRQLLAQLVVSRQVFWEFRYPRAGL